MSFDARIAGRLENLRNQGLARELPPISQRRGARYLLAGHEVVGFCSNDYLGLADDEPPPRAAPSGASGSRLICGDLDLHRTAERELAALVGAPDAVLFPSGFQLNVGVLPLVVEQGDIVHSDQLNHASIIDGLRLSGARPRVIPHASVPAFEPAAVSTLRWWVVESIFSMDGDRIDTAQLARFVDQGGCTYVDEAHALGLFAGGRGLLGDGPLPTLLVGTLSKAFGCAGAFVAAGPDACHYIRTRARSFVFSTGTSPALVPRILHAVDRVRGPDGDRLRERLWHNVERFAAALGLRGPSPSPIFPLVVGDNDTAVTLARMLLARGFHVQPIRPPTVPAGTARLRATVTAAHTSEQIDALAAVLRELFEQRGLPIRVERGCTTPSSDPSLRPALAARTEC